MDAKIVVRLKCSFHQHFFFASEFETCTSNVENQILFHKSMVPNKHSVSYVKKCYYGPPVLVMAPRSGSLGYSTHPPPLPFFPEQTCWGRGGPLG